MPVVGVDLEPNHPGSSVEQLKTLPGSGRDLAVLGIGDDPLWAGSKDVVAATSEGLPVG